MAKSDRLAQSKQLLSDLLQLRRVDLIPGDIGVDFGLPIGKSFNDEAVQTALTEMDKPRRTRLIQHCQAENELLREAQARPQAPAGRFAFA